MFRADLHIHSTYSDGALSCEELVALACERNLNAISITDHDTIQAYPALNALCKQNNLHCIPGVELSSHYNGHSIHVLGYGFDLKAPIWEQVTKQLYEARLERMNKIIHKIEKRGKTLNIEASESLIIRPQLAQILIKKGIVKDHKEAFTQYLNDSKIGGLTLKALTVEEAIAVIHEAKGYAVLAHPHHIKQKNKFIKMLSLRFDGIEAFHGTMHDQADYFERYALEYNKLTTGGSDFHNSKHGRHLGCSFTNQAVFEKFYQRALENNQNWDL